MRTVRRLVPAASLTILLAAPSVLAGQQPAAKHITLEQYLDWEEVQAPQLSPDATQIAYSRRWVDKMNDKWETSVWIMNADGSRARQLSQ
jgi:hypothetical protein